MPVFSCSFIALSAIVALIARLLRPGTVRTLVFLLTNLFFFLSWMNDPLSVLAACGLLVATWLAGEAKVRWQHLRSTPVVFTVVVICLWIFLFMGKDNSLFPLVNPFFKHPIQIIGISYLVFRCIHYVMDVTLFKTRPFFTFINYALYFPSLIAGPIERFDKYQVFEECSENVTDKSQILADMHRIANGFLKKYIIADNLFFLIAFDNIGELSLLGAWISFLALPFILYMDFSGYTDIAIGVSSLIGLRLRENFNKPFMATNIQDFWNRWHMSLTSWIKDYVFNPLYIAALRRDSLFRHQFAASTIILAFTMVLIALWHGTSVAWVFYGIVQGSALVIFQAYKRWGRPRLPAAVSYFLYKTSLGPWVGRGLLYLFIAASTLIWRLDPEDGLILLLRLVGGSA